MSHFEPYPIYKDSGVEWLGQVPEHWDVRAIKWLSPVQRGASPRPIDDPKYFDDENGEYGWVRIEDVSSSDGILLSTKQKLSTLGSSLSVKLKPGSLFLSIAGTVGKPCVTQVKACIHDGFVYFPCLSVNPSWLYKIFESRTPFVGLGKLGTQLNLNTETVGGIKVAIPPAEEIDTILGHLANETARIDALVEKKTRFIELLREKRQALITHAVTKGLDSNVKMKDSGVEWLGEVPEHWAVRPIKGVVDTPITDGPHETPNFIDEGVPFVSAEAVSSGVLNFEKIRGYISEEDHARFSKKYKPQKHDIYMVKSGATTGVTAIVDVDREFNIWSPLAVIRCVEKMAPYFVLNFMRSRSFLEAVALNWSFGTQQNIGMGVIGNLQITVPPLDEQLEIAAHLEIQTRRIDALVAKTERSIELLKERRSALITAAVTGQIDLREAA